VYNGFLVNKDNITIKATGEAIITPVIQPGINDVPAGVTIHAVGVEIDGLTINDSDIRTSLGISGFEDVKVEHAEYTVKNTTFINLQTGIYANSTNQVPLNPLLKAELTAIGNTFTNCAAGIGGTESTTLNAIEGNIFTNCGEGIGLGGGVETTVVPLDQLIAYLQNNNDFVNCTYDVRDWR